MKVSIGSKIVEGPWGGGNLFVKNLSSYLKELGHEVIYDLSESDIDLILLTDPRSRRESSSTFNHEDINKYKKFINPNTSVVQRINECDERKNTDNINIFYLEASSCANKVVFVSKWLEDIYLELGMSSTKSQVIMSGSDKKVFKNYHNKIKNNKVKVVTHHWSSHKNKGFESYEVIDKLLKDPKWKNKLEFSYIGNSSSDYPLNNSILVEPLSGISLASKLSENDIYLTGSINEPSGNHHIEAALCGLPILYLDSGGTPEYCNNYGVAYRGLDELEEKLEYIIENQEVFKEELKKYPFNSENMNKEYLELFNLLVADKSLNKIQINKIYQRLYLLRFKLSKFTRKFSQVNIRTRIKKILSIWK
jgi:glycosyltransferase involved in cell wall biosynthesis